MIGTVRAEWTKLRTIRSSWWTLAPTVLVGAALGALVSVSFRSAAPNDIDQIFATFYGLTLAQLPLVVFGILLVGGEYGASHSIVASLLATPDRTRFYAAKVFVGGLTAAATSLVTVAATYVAAQRVLGPDRVALGDPGVLRAVVGGWLYLFLICLFAIGIATMLRSAVLTLAVLVPVLFLGSQGLANIPKVRTVTQFLPDTAGTMIIHLAGPPDDPVFDRAYGPWGGVGILALWAMLALVGGYVVLRHRDA